VCAAANGSLHHAVSTRYISFAVSLAASGQKLKLRNRFCIGFLSLGVKQKFMVTLFVGGFPLDMDETGLVKIFMPFGQVSTVKIVRDKKTRICKGYAFLEVADAIAASDMISNLDKLQYGDRYLSVSVREDTAKPENKGVRPPTKTVNYVKVQKSTESEKKKRPRRSIS
jgi:RNA recognition motif-containing protein